RLIKGYGDTHKRGTGNFALIEERVIRPVLAGAIPLPQGIDAIASARTAALKDPEGESLARCLADIEGHASLRIAAEQPGRPRAGGPSCRSRESGNPYAVPSR